MLYTRRQLIVLLLLIAAAGCGLAIGHWRREYPDLVERLEQLDRAPAPAASIPVPRGARVRTARTAADAEPRPARRSRRETPEAPLVAPNASPTPDPVDLDRMTDGSAPCP